MRAKYIEERYPHYFIFGEHKGTNFVDIATAENSTLATMSREHAEALIADREALLSKLVATALAFDEAAPDAFMRFWYGDV